MYVALWMCALPVLIRLWSLPVLLARMAAEGRTAKPRIRAWDVDVVVGIVVAVSQLRVFQSQLFLRSCLRRSLTLYRSLTRMGYPARIHFGVRKQGSSFLGHSWVTLYGRPLAETDAPEVFTTVYSYPLSAHR
jgi:hypothetical protein